MSFRIKNIIRSLPLINKTKRGNYHHKTLAIYKDITSVCSLFSCEKLEVIDTEIPIRYNDNHDFGTNINKLKEKLGTPDYSLKKQVCSLEFKILVYRMRLGGLNTRLELHFYEDSLFYYNYIFSHIKNKEKRKLKKLLKLKYLKSKSNLKNKVIVDQSNNKIKISNNINFTINYITGDVNILKELFAIKNADKITKQIDAKYINNSLLKKI